MLDPQRIVADLRSLLQGSDQTLTDRVRQLATDYETVAREANDRLRRCEDFLQKGLRSEAVHLADVEPPLLDLVGILDFPERPQWEQIAAAHGLASPPRLSLPTAEALNRAYAEEHPLESLLRQHRRLALARAPIRERLGVLRQLAQADPASSVWREDVRAFEKTRLEQIHGEANQARAVRDDIALAAIMQELQGCVWEEAPPEPLLRQIEEGARAGAQQHAWKHLQRVAGDLQAAFSMRDAQRAAVLRAEWATLSEAAAIVPGDPLFRRVAQIFQWLDQLQHHHDTEQAYRLAVEKLEQAFVQCNSTETLESLYLDVKRFKRPMPAAMTRRYKDRMSHLNVSANRREKYILAATFLAGALALVGLIVFLLMRQH